MFILAAKVAAQMATFPVIHFIKKNEENCNLPPIQSPPAACIGLVKNIRMKKAAAPARWRDMVIDIMALPRRNKRS